MYLYRLDLMYSNKKYCIMVTLQLEFVKCINLYINPGESWVGVLVFKQIFDRLKDQTFDMCN